MVKISRNELVPGDQIYSYRKAYVYAHHGFDPKKDHGVVKSCLKCFLLGRKLRRVKYGFSSKRRLLKRPATYSKENSDDAKTVLGRAEKLLKENSFGKYNLMFNNCESFARYCMTGNKVSKQAVAAGIAGGTAIAVLL
ncbi:LRAT domain [Dillenia turbinata]|uniref:LRAT domain n=1 Tax=Dillenia turbinata TaxID=194707 RepID=A0AAN8VJU9_9MAGN